jgi:hypothetical protein
MNLHYVRFETFTAVTMKNVVFCDRHLLTLVPRSRIFLS